MMAGPKSQVSEYNLYGDPGFAYPQTGALTRICLQSSKASECTLVHSHFTLPLRKLNKVQRSMHGRGYTQKNRPSFLGIPEGREGPSVCLVVGTKS